MKAFISSYCYFISRKLVLLLISSFISYGVLSQTKTKDLLNSQLIIDEFRETDGFVFNDFISSMVYDNYGWLWISGVGSEANNYKLGNRSAEILRFDGSSFYSVKYPEEENNSITEIKLFKKNENTLYVSFFYQNRVSIYTLNTFTLNFTKLDLPTSKYFNEKYESILLKSDESFIYIQQSAYEKSIYKIDESDKIILLNTSKSIENLKEVKYIQLKDHFLLSNHKIGIEKYSNRAEYLRSLSSGDFDKLQIKTSENLFIDSSINNHNKQYIRLKQNNTYFKYNSKDKKWIFQKIDQFNPENGLSKFIYEYADHIGNTIIKKVINGKTELYVYKNLSSKCIWRYTLPYETANSPIIASRDFLKEFISNTNKKMLRFTYGKQTVDSYLKDFSIRSILQLSDDEFIVCTDFNGWYLVNILDGSVKEISFLLDGKEMAFPSQNRGIYLQGNTIWSNDNHGLIEVNKEDFSVKRHLSSLIISSLDQDDDSILLADRLGGVYLFNKKTKTSEILFKRENTIFEKIIRDNNSIYGATNKGLIVYNNDLVSLYQPEQKDDQYFISIVNHNELGILLGTRSGKLMRFDGTNNSFEVLYHDEFKASIASILSKDDYLWINTFAGIVAYDISSGKHMRFGKNDGFSHYEANRHSYLKSSNGDFLVGTIKGVNYFNPEKLIKKSKDNIKLGELQFIALTYYNNSLKDEVTNQNLIEINNLKEITLSATEKNIRLDFGLLKPPSNISFSYRYRLNNDSWTNLKNVNTLSFNSLSAGKYNLEIEAIDIIKQKVLGSRKITIVVPLLFYKSYWFYLTVVLVISSVLMIYMNNWKKTKQAILNNKLLTREIDYKKKDLSDFASNLSREQQWNNYIISKMEELKQFKGRKKGVALLSLEKEIKEKNQAMSNSFEFQKRIKILSNEFYNQLLKKYPKLSKTDLKLCSLIRLDLNNNDIASIQNVDISSVYTSRYRLRKKLNLTSDADLDTFLKAF